MSATTPSQSKAAVYIAEKRAEAAAAGSPIRRMYFSPYASTVSGREAIHFYSLKDDQLSISYRSTDPDQVATDHLTCTEIEAVLSNGILVLVDRATRLKLIRKLRQSGERAKNLAEIISYMARQPSSLRCLVLTDLLAKRYWLPDTLDESSIDDWRQAFGGLSDRDMFTLAVADPAEPDPDDEEGIEWSSYISKANVAIRHNEPVIFSKGYQRESLPRPADQDAIYRAAEAVSNAATAIEQFDPLASEVHLRSGQVVDFEPAYVNQSNVVGRLTEPCRLKVGAKLRVVPTIGGTISDGAAVLDSMFFDEDEGQLYGVVAPITKPGKKGAGYLYRAFDRALMKHETLRLAPEPFLAGEPARVISSRWSGHGPNSASEFTRRDVPLDVSLSGGVEWRG